MEDKGKVEVVGEPTVKVQFGDGSYYRVPETIDKKRVKLLGAVIGAALLLAVVVGPPEKSSREKQEIPEPDHGSSFSGVPQIDQYFEGAPSLRRSTASGQRFVSTPGLQVMTRKDLFKIVPGTFAHAQILTGASLGFVKAKLLEKVPDTPIEAGSILIGKSEPSSDRIMIRFEKLLGPDKKTLSLTAYAADTEDKAPGIKVSMWNTHALRFGLTAGLHFLGGVAEGLQTKEQVGNEVVTEPNFKNALLNGTKDSALETSNQLLNEYKNKPPKLAVKDGLKIIVVFEGDVESQN